MLKNKIEYFAFLLLAGLFRILGITRARKLAILLGSFFFSFIPIRKKTVVENLRIAFPGKTEKEIHALAKNAFKNFSLTFTDLLLMQNLSKEQLKKIVDFSEADGLFKEHFSSGKSFFILTGHFGNWEMFASVPLFFGREMNAMAKPMRNIYVSDWINKSREKFGVNVVLLGSSIREVYKVLKENGVVLSVNDQRGPSDGIRVNFFNKSTAVFNGSAALALRTSTPILMAFCVRGKDLNYKIIAEPLDYGSFVGSEEEKIILICQKYFNFLETVIRQYPDQWFWMHKIWKY